MSELLENPTLMLELLAKLTHRNGGYLRITKDDPPTTAFNFMSRIDHAAGVVEMRIEEDKEAGTA